MFFLSSGDAPVAVLVFLVFGATGASRLLIHKKHSY